MVFYKTNSKSEKNNIYIDKFLKTIAKTGAYLLMAIFLFQPYPMYALTDEEQLQNLNKQIEAAQSQLSALKNEKATLQQELSNFEAQIAAIQAQIDATQGQINIINKQIIDTNKKIAIAESDLAKQRDIMDEYLRTMYIEGQVSTLELIAESKNFSDFVDRSEYINTMQQKVQETADKIVELKNQLNEQKKTARNKKS